MEKRVATYDLETVKLAFSTVKKLRATATALKDARLMGFTQQDMVDAIQQLKRKDFVKSMTTHSDHRIWQDVYNTEYNGYFLYIKFQVDEMGHFVISFKEK
ncbi:MAG: type II toxin-antitoxin system MqsR family toxin [Gammaproteobacteria bacterium]|nr:type II toxin-antitoxin system MqsR family toxin [Gammaproteobacteria bacterium]MCW5583365.1 type II toxin-antitoxin system MqsR family toxin [Gammaproteobacteria bacterium]